MFGGFFLLDKLGITRWHLSGSDKIWVHPTRAGKDQGKQTSWLTWVITNGIYNLFYPSQGAWKRLSGMCKKMDVEELQEEVWDSKQVLSMGAEEAEMRRGGGKRCSEVFLGKGEGWEETEAKGKLFRASSTGKCPCEGLFHTLWFPHWKIITSQQLCMVEFWGQKVKGIKLS